MGKTKPRMPLCLVCHVCKKEKPLPPGGQAVSGWFLDYDAKFNFLGDICPACTKARKEKNDAVE